MKNYWLDRKGDKEFINNVKFPLFEDAVDWVTVDIQSAKTEKSLFSRIEIIFKQIAARHLVDKGFDFISNKDLGIKLKNSLD